MDIKAKLRPFYVAKMLYNQTDEEHYLTIAQIIVSLKRNMGYLPHAVQSVTISRHSKSLVLKSRSSNLLRTDII